MWRATSPARAESASCAGAGLRCVFLVESSAAMAPYRSQIGDIVAGYVLNGLDGQLREGDLLSMWVLDPALPSNRLLPLIWSRQTREVIAVHCAKAIQAWPVQTSGAHEIGGVLQDALQCAAPGEKQHLMIIHRGQDLTGTGVDRNLNAAFRSARTARSSPGLYVTTLLADTGKVVAWSTEPQLIDVAEPAALVTVPESRSAREPGLAPAVDALMPVTPAVTRRELKPGDALPEPVAERDVTSVSANQKSDVLGTHAPDAAVKEALPMARPRPEDTVRPSTVTVPDQALTDSEMKGNGEGDKPTLSASPEPTGLTVTRAEVAPTLAVPTPQASANQVPLPERTVRPIDEMVKSAVAVLSPTASVTATSSIAQSNNVCMDSAPHRKATNVVAAPATAVPGPSGQTSGALYLALGLGLLGVATLMLLYFAKAAPSGQHASSISQSLDHN